MDRYTFRGKIEETGRWVYGYYTKQNNGCHVMFAPKMDGIVWADYHVDPKTIGQCTGTKDKNGSLVYEGDICRTPNGTQMTVVFDGDRFVFKNENNSFGLSYYANSVEIIGNLHDKETA